MPVHYKNISSWGEFENIHTKVFQELRENALVVELGVASGRGIATMLHVAEKLKKKLVIHGIDHFKGTVGEEQLYGDISVEKTTAIIEAIGGDPSQFTLFCNDTAAAASLYNEVDYVFLDADHTEAGVLRDLQAWWPKVRKGGYIGGHDWQFPTVSKAVRSFFPAPEIIDQECWLWRKA